jgi:pimeloyl-ACP methyl ester carboxylesterase
MTQHKFTVSAPEAGPIAEMSGFAHAYAKVNGARIHYVIGGSGPAVVLVHGWPYTWVVWRKFMPALVTAGFTVIAPDVRGIGDSDKTVGGYSKVNVATDIHELVQGLGFETINLVGMDIGAMVAFAYATTFPAGLHRLVLSESVIPGFGLEELMNPAAGGHWHFGFFQQVDTATMLVTGHEAEFLGRFWKMGSVIGVSDADRTQYLNHYSGPEGLRGGFEHYGTLLDDGKANRELVTTPLATPILVLNGDSGITRSVLLDGARRAAKSVEFDIVPAAGHTYAADNPNWTAQRLTAFFRQ